MDFKEVKEFILTEMEKNIKKVLDGEVDSITLHYVRPSDVITCVEKLGGTDDDNMDTNGWQWDYWLYFSYEGNRYSLGGDGFYQDTSSFSLDNE